MRPILIAAALLLAAFSVPVVADSAPAPGASSVAEMLQRKQEHQLREQLAKEGRWEEIRQMDEEQAQHQQIQKGQALNKVNEALARKDGADTAAGGAGNLCDPNYTAANLRGKNPGTKSVGAQQNTMQVR